MNDFAARLTSLVSEPSRDDGHDPHRFARVERTRAEMMAQGAAMRETLRAEEEAVTRIAADLSGTRTERIVIAGCGDSWFVGMAVRHAFETLLGVPVEAAQALDFAAYGAAVVDERTLVIGLSAGGNTPAVMNALAAARGQRARALGLSNTPDSPILERFDAGLLIRASRKGWPTQSSTAAAALLLRLAAALAERKGRDVSAFLARLAGLPEIVDATARSLDAPVATVAERVAEANIVLFTGLGPNAAAAAMGAAKVRELSSIHAVAFPLEEMHHYRLPKRGDPLLVVATDPPSRERALDTALVAEAVGAHVTSILSRPDPDIEARSATVLRVPEMPATLAPLLACIPLHLFAYHFSKARFARGLGYQGGGV